MEFSTKTQVIGECRAITGMSWRIRAVTDPSLKNQVFWRLTWQLQLQVALAQRIVRFSTRPG